MDTFICMSESLTVPLKLSQYCLLIGYTPIQNKKFKKKKNKGMAQGLTIDRHSAFASSLPFLPPVPGYHRF